MAQESPPQRKIALVALVTGCDSEGGIGQALCRTLASRGLLVYATGLSLDSMAELRAYAPEQIRTLVMDVTNELQVRNVINQVVSEAGGIDVLVNNAGIGALGPSLELDLAVARRVHEVNFWGTWAVCKAAGPDMIRRRRGVIVNIGSMASRGHPPFSAPYNTSKAATESLTRSLRLELAAYGIAVVYVAPTWCRTPIVKNGIIAGEADWNAGNYGPVRDIVLQQANGTTRPDAWSPERIAARIVDAALRPRPPTVVYGGGQYIVLGILAHWLPGWLAEWIIWQKCGLAKLAESVRRGDRKRALH